MRMREDPAHAPLAIVTGASSNHFECLRNLLLSIRTHEPAARLVVYDLGLSSAEREQLGREGAADLRRFPFEEFPEWVSIDPARSDYGRRAGCYAWKPVILWVMACEAKGPALWLDAGNLVRRPLVDVRHELLRAGLFTPASPGNIRRWTHPATLAQFVQPGPQTPERPMRNAAIVGADARVPATFDLLRQYREFSLRQEVIAPAEANWSNHRFDQSILSLLACQWEAETGLTLATHCAEITTHHDRESEASARALIGL